MNKQILTILILFLIFGCEQDDGTIQIDSTCNLNMDDFDYSFGIDYSNPEQYLIPGEQSDLDTVLFREVADSIGEVSHTIYGMLKVCHWIDRNFQQNNAVNMGIKTIDELVAGRITYDSHSTALVVSGILRKFGFPAVMVETASVNWAYEYRGGVPSGYNIHVMSEIYVDEKWVLLDNNCTFVSDYHPQNPFIPAMNKNLWQQGLFVYAKGKDSWDYGVKEKTDSENKITVFASQLPCFEPLLNSVEYTWKN